MAPEVKSFAYGVDFSPPLLQQMADLNKIIEDDDDALADRLFIIDKMFTYHCGTNMQNFIRFPAKILSKICDNAQKKSYNVAIRIPNSWQFCKKKYVGWRKNLKI